LEATLRLARVLETTIIQGLTTNRDFLVAVLRTPEFLAGDTTTDFIDRVNPVRSHIPDQADLCEAAMAATLLAQCKRHQQAKVLKSIPSGWRNTVMPPESVSYLHADSQLTVDYQAQRDGSFQISTGESANRVVIQSWSENDISLTIDGRRMSCTVVADGNRWLVHGPGGQIEFAELPRFPIAVHEGISGGLIAPMPGNVLACYVKQGDQVEQGQLLLILEAMKMEHRITAPDAGVISEIRIEQGDQVSNGELLIVLSQNEET
jgi:propionyl-CoA carboxylase alpha chain